MKLNRITIFAVFPREHAVVAAILAVFTIGDWPESNAFPSGVGVENTTTASLDRRREISFSKSDERTLEFHTREILVNYSSLNRARATECNDRHMDYYRLRNSVRRAFPLFRLSDREQSQVAFPLIVETPRPSEIIFSR